MTNTHTNIHTNTHRTRPRGVPDYIVVPWTFTLTVTFIRAVEYYYLYYCRSVWTVLTNWFLEHLLCPRKFPRAENQWTRNNARSPNHTPNVELEGGAGCAGYKWVDIYVSCDERTHIHKHNIYTYTHPNRARAVPDSIVILMTFAVTITFISAVEYYVCSFNQSRSRVPFCARGGFRGQITNKKQQ